MERLLEVKDLSISFGGIKAVQDLNFHIDKGEVLALIGPNGSGKSTTVNMISGVYIQNKGTITFDGKEMAASLQSMCSITAKHVQYHCKAYAASLQNICSITARYML